jgi:hypothetical protein
VVCAFLQEQGCETIANCCAFVFCCTPGYSNKPDIQSLRKKLTLVSPVLFHLSDSEDGKSPVGF